MAVFVKNDGVIELVGVIARAQNVDGIVGADKKGAIGRTHRPLGGNLGDGSSGERANGVAARDDGVDDIPRPALVHSHVDRAQIQRAAQPTGDGNVFEIIIEIKIQHPDDGAVRGEVDQKAAAERGAAAGGGH